MNPWRNVQTRPGRDLGGKPVDVHTRPRVGYGLHYDGDSVLSQQKLQDEVVARLRLIRDSPSKRIRDRRFNVWYGVTSSGDDEVTATLGFPDNISSEPWRLLRSLADLRGYVDQGGFPMVDFAGAPLARYDHGRITVYLRPDATEPTDAPDVDYRSAVINEPTPPSATRVMRRPADRGAIWHTPETWDENRTRILRFVWELRAAGTFSRLVEITEEHFGIMVRQDMPVDGPRLGALRLGFLAPDGVSTQVCVTLRGDLHDDLKYVVLAHELGHYVMHFPLLYDALHIDQLSAVIPELAPAFSTIVKQHLEQEWLEYQADHFASNMLIPPRYNLSAVAGMYFEMDHQPTAAELAWRFLQPLFPNTMRDEMGWANATDRRQRAAAALRSLGDSPGSLYERMLKATVERVNHGSHDPGEQVERALEEVSDELGELIARCREASSAHEARDRLADGPLSAHTPEAFPDDLAVARFEVVPAVDTDGRLPRSIRLVPADTNPNGDRDGLWINVQQPDAGDELTLEDWTLSRSDDVELRVYRHEQWQLRRLIG